MQADRLTNIETGVAVTQASGGTALAPVNLTPRCRYGANLYIESGYPHFLNDNSEFLPVGGSRPLRYAEHLRGWRRIPQAS